MKIIIEVGHPAHVHLFKNMIWELQKKGHDFKIVASVKDVTIDLLDLYGFNYEVLNDNDKGNKFLSLLRGEMRLFRIVKNFHPDLFISKASPISGLISRLFHRPHIAIVDSEHTKKFLKYWLFTIDVILTPSSYNEELGKKQIRFNGFKESAYLHPNYYTPDKSTLSLAGLSDGEKYILLRFVAWNAYHDVGHIGFTSEFKTRLVKSLSSKARVLISSERPLPPELQNYRISLKPTRIHDLLYFATLYLGDGATMATEAALLGTPSLYLSSLSSTIGNFRELEEKYDLLYRFSNQECVIEKVLSLLDNNDLKTEWALKTKKLFSEKIDVTSFLIWFIDNFPNSIKKVLVLKINCSVD